MKKLTLNFTVGTTTSTENAKSEANMWTILRKVRDNLTDQNLADGARCQVLDEEGHLFKDITFKKNSKGKIEMPNAIKETCRRQVEKARKAAKAAAEKAAARKAKKAEANRRYRAKLKARQAAEKVGQVDKAA